MTPIKTDSFFESVKCALRGLSESLLLERNVRLDTVAAFLVAMACVLFRPTFDEIALLVLCVSFVMALEIMNSAIETVVDLATLDVNPLARRAKDMAAGSVLFGAFGSAIVAGIVFVPKIARTISGNWGFSENQLLGFFGLLIGLLWFCTWWMKNPLQPTVEDSPSAPGTLDLGERLQSNDESSTR